jgi:LemA protein
MGKTGRTLGIVGIVIVVVLLIVYFSLKGTYNSLVQLDEGVKGAWAQVENQLQRRYDLIPNYVETVKGYAKQERPAQR